jgi:hypothetical protein
MGFEIPLDWSALSSVKPYGENKELSKQRSVNDLKAISESDVFLILGDEAGTGMYVELGAAILANMKLGKPKIFAIGPWNDNMMFYFHDVVNRKDTIEQVLDELKEWLKKRN